MQAPEKSFKINPPLTPTVSKDVAALKAALEIELKNKKQCAYQPYECTQLTIDGYNYCLKHILYDKTAPFKQCFYVYASNGKRCQLGAPKVDKRDYAYCHEHALRTALAKNRENSKYAPPPTGESLLLSLGHYVKKARNKAVSGGSTDEPFQEENFEQKATKGLDPFRKFFSL